MQKNNTNPTSLINVDDLIQFVTNEASEINENLNFNEFMFGEIAINDNIIGGARLTVSKPFKASASRRVPGAKATSLKKIKPATISSKKSSNITERVSTNVHIFYFIGRLNPPHSGHIKALKTLVQMANSQNTVPLILLGSGPKGGERTMDNPITFELKQAFIRSILERELPGSNYVIKKMSNPATDVPLFIEERLSGLGPINSISIKQIAGGKDEDATKLSFVMKAATEKAREIGAEVSAKVEAIDAETTDESVAMSATKVRKDAYKTLLDGSGFNGWVYKDFYGPEFALSIYNEIIEPAQRLDNDVIQEYIDTGRLPGKRGGKRRRRTNKKRHRANKKKTARHKI